MKIRLNGKSFKGAKRIAGIMLAVLLALVLVVPGTTAFAEDDGTENLSADTGETILISENCVFANGIPIVIKENNEITSIYSQDGTLLSGAENVRDKWIFGGWNGGKHSANTSVTMESGVVTRNIYGGSLSGTIEGDTFVEIKGGTVGWVYGGGEDSTVNGTAKVTVYAGARILGGEASNTIADAFNRGTVFGGGLNGTVEKTEVTLLGGDFGWAYGGGENCTVDSTNIKLLGNPDLWCNVYGGGNGGRIGTANLTVRKINPGYAVYMYGGGWNDSVTQANITIGGDVRLAENVPIYATGSGDTNSSNTSTVENVNFVIDNFDLISTGNTTVCGPLVGTKVTGTANVLVTGTKSSGTSMQLKSKDIDKIKIEQGSVVLFGANPEDPGNPIQPLKLGCLELASSGEAVFPAGNESVVIEELAGSGTLAFEGQAKQPMMITGVKKVSSTAAAPLQIKARGASIVIDDTVFISGAGVTSAACFRSDLSNYTAVLIDHGIQLKPSSTVKKYTSISRAEFDKNSYTYGDVMTLSIDAIVTGGAPLAGEPVYIIAGNRGTQLTSAVLDSEGKATVTLPVDSFLMNVMDNSSDKTLKVLYNGSDQYVSALDVFSLTGTKDTDVKFSAADISLTQEITAPALNSKPMTELSTDNEFFTAEVVWTPATTVFEADTAYSADIILKPKQGYDLEHIGIITYQGTVVTPQQQSDGSRRLSKVKSFDPISSGSVEVDYKTSNDALDIVPEGVTSLFSGIEELKGALYTGTTAKLADILKENMVYYDVQLLVSLDGEQSWQAAVPGNFPSGGIEVTLPYPDGTDSKNYDFVVAHMITRAMNGKTPGEIEFPDIQETESGITFRVYSLSPISVGWKKVASGENPGGGTEETTPGAPEETTPGAPEETTPGGGTEETTPGAPEETTPGGGTEETTPGAPEETTPGGGTEETTPGAPEETTPGGGTEETTPGGETEVDYKTSRGALDIVPEGVTSLFSSIEELKGALYTGTAAKFADILKENMVYYDVQLLVSLDGEQSWQPAVQGNFPSGGIEITLPYPDGTDSKNYDFVVAHMLTRAMNGKTPGEIEFPDIQKTESGITFRVYSLSPISVGWKKVASGENPGAPEETTPGVPEETTQGVSTEPETEAEIVVSPSTGNNNSILVYSIMLISIMGMVGVVTRKK